MKEQIKKIIDEIDDDDIFLVSLYNILNSFIRNKKKA